MPRHWIVRWFIFRWAGPIVAIVTFFQAAFFLFAVDDRVTEFLSHHRGVVAFALISSLIMSFLHELLSVDSYKLDHLERDRLLDDDRRDP